MNTRSQLLNAWMAQVLNIGFYFFYYIVNDMKPVIGKMHSKMFGISKMELSLIYFKYLANYKIFYVLYLL